MSVLPIILAPDRRLKAVCADVERFDDDLARRLDDMLETMYEAPGIGLAGPQVGDMRRLLVADISGDDEPATPLRLVNPSVVWASDERVTANEGCLSLPEIYVDVTRPAEVRVAYLDETGKPGEIEASGLLARCLQHEIDHLAGVLHIDHASLIKRNMALRKMAKVKQSRQRAAS